MKSKQIKTEVINLSKVLFYFAKQSTERIRQWIANKYYFLYKQWTMSKLETSHVDVTASVDPDRPAYLCALIRDELSEASMLNCSQHDMNIDYMDLATSVVPDRQARVCKLIRNVLPVTSMLKDIMLSIKIIILSSLKATCKRDTRGINYILYYGGY